MTESENQPDIYEAQHACDRSCPQKHLVDRVVWHRSLADNLSLLHSESLLREARGALGDDLDTVLLSLDLSSIVSLDAVEEFLAAAGLHHVLDADVHALGDDAASHNFVDDDTDSMRGDVENTSGAAVVELVWHTLLDSGVSLNVDVVPKTVVVEVGRHVWHTLGSERAREHVARAAAVTLGLHHVETELGTGEGDPH